MNTTSELINALDLPGITKNTSLELIKTQWLLEQAKLENQKLKKRNKACQKKRLAFYDKLAAQPPQSDVETNHDYFRLYIANYFLTILKEISNQYHGALPIESDRANDNFLNLYDRVSGSASVNLPVNPLNLLGAFLKALTIQDHDWAKASLAHADEIIAYLPNIKLLAEKIADKMARHYQLFIEQAPRGQVRKLADAALEILLRVMKEGGWLQDFSEIDNTLNYDELANQLVYDIIFSHAKSFVKFSGKYQGKKDVYADDALWKGGFLLINSNEEQQYYQYINPKENEATLFPPVILFEDQLPSYMNNDFVAWYHEIYLPNNHGMSAKRKVKTGARHAVHAMSEVLGREGFFPSHEVIDEDAREKYLHRLWRQYGLTQQGISDAGESTMVALSIR